jgi:hypothetical protein
VTLLAKNRVSFLKINDINDISFFGTPDCHLCGSIALAGMPILWLCYSVSVNANSMVVNHVICVAFGCIQKCSLCYTTTQRGLSADSRA